MLSRTGLEQIEQSIFQKKTTNVFATCSDGNDFEKVRDERYSKLIKFFRDKAFAGNDAAKQNFFENVLAATGVDVTAEQTRNITFLQRITTHATHEERKKFFDFLSNIARFT